MTVANHRNLARAAGVVLAAGNSVRMGRPKALLDLPRAKGGTFVARAVGVLSEAGLHRVAVVVNPRTADLIEKACPKECFMVVNPRPEDGMISSIRIGLAALGDVDRLFITLVDTPGVDPRVIERLLSEPVADRTWATIPRYKNGRGHPILLHKACFPMLETELPKGLKSLFERAEDRIIEVKIDALDPRDIDTPEDYAAWLATG